MRDDVPTSAPSIAQFDKAFINPRFGQSCYSTPSGDDIWKLMLIIAVSQVRDESNDDPLARHDSPRSNSDVEVGVHEESRLAEWNSSSAYLESVLEGILERLPPQNRVMVTLRLDGCEVAEVARLTGRSMRSVERILHESCLKLAALLPKED